MPLVRVEVRNGYALGAPELYRETNKEDPKEILESVSVAGLVGVLRQLGDLAEFAAEVFHGVQEEVVIMSSRSRKLMGRVQRIEASLSPLEKAVLAQKSHLHFAYTAGSNWHARIRCRQNHFVYGDLPQFIMDSYDDCRDPPRLHLLDKFDSGGPGSCLKRYSDPTFFRRLSEAAGGVSDKKITKEKKGRKSKKRSRPRNGEVSRDELFAYYSGRMQFTQLNVGGHSSPSRTATTAQSALDDRPNSDLRDGLDYAKGDFRPSYSTQPEEQESRESISSAIMRRNSDFLEYDFLKGEITDTYDDIRTIPSLEQAASSSFVTWDEKGEMLEHVTQVSDNDGPLQEGDHRNRHISNLVIESPDDTAADFEMVNRMDLSLYDQFVPPLESNDAHPDDIESEMDHFMDALNVIESDADTDVEGMKKQEMQQHFKLDVNKIRDELSPPIRHDLECQSSSSETNVVANGSPINAICEDLDSVSRKSPQETNGYIDGVPEKDGVNSVSTVDETVISSQTDEVSLTPSSPQSVDWTEKQNLQQSSKPVNNEVRDEVYQAVRHDFEFHQSLITETNVLANGSLISTSCGHLNSESPESLQETDVYFNGVTAKDEYNSASFVAKTLPTSQADGVSSIGSSPLSADSRENGGVAAEKYVKSVSCAVPSDFTGLGLGVPINNGSTSSLESQRHASDTSSVAPVTFWTNGGLLGLQPSKPPDFGASNGIAQDPVQVKERKINPFDFPGKLKNVEDDCDMSGSNHNQESGTSSRKPSWKISPADLGINLGKFGDSLCSSTSSIGSSGTVPGSLPPVNLASQTTTKHQENNRNSSQVFEFSNRLLSKTSTERLSPGVNGNFYTTDDQIVSAGEKKDSRIVARTFSGQRKDLFCNESPILSPSSSPPLQHMKISFQPTDQFESSKLKLKFPDGIVNSGNVSDIFPSFQLVPEASITQQVSGYDSDPDPFYRSSPSLSDGCHSDQSESNSEQWESGESPTSKDHELYYALRRISLMESVSSVPENVRATHEDTRNSSGFQFPHAQNGLQNSESSRMYDLHCLGSATTHSFRKEPSSGTNMKDLIEPQAQPSPAPPPLPPVEWRDTMPHLDSMEDKCETVPETSYSGFCLHRSPSTISQPKPAPSTEDKFNPKVILKSKSNLHKMNGQIETGLGKSTEDKGDFLHQIRTKSFNLRPTFIKKSAAPFEASTRGQVTAILEKANAIRQAVGSDEEDDGTWSDT